MGEQQCAGDHVYVRCLEEGREGVLGRDALVQRLAVREGCHERPWPREVAGHCIQAAGTHKHPVCYCKASVARVSRLGWPYFRDPSLALFSNSVCMSIVTLAQRKVNPADRSGKG